VNFLANEGIKGGEVDKLLFRVQLADPFKLASKSLFHPCNYQTRPLQSQQLQNRVLVEGRVSLPKETYNKVYKVYIN
jgi:hypothetical protein